MAQQAHLHLIRYALDRGCSIRVNDGEEIHPHSTDFNVIKDRAGAVDEAHLRIYNANGKLVGIAFIVFGNAPEELVADHSDNSWFADWWAEYEAKGMN